MWQTIVAVPLIVLIVAIALPFMLFYYIARLVRGLWLRSRVKFSWPRGKVVLLAYTNNRKWVPYIEEQLLPRIGDACVIVDSIPCAVEGALSTRGERNLTLGRLSRAQSAGGRISSGGPSAGVSAVQGVSGAAARERPTSQAGFEATPGHGRTMQESQLTTRWSGP
jgi:hypothetical protein